MSRPERLRIDRLLVERGLASSRHKAQALVMAGQVLVDGKVVDKSGTAVDRDLSITLKQGSRYVGRGGLKLEGALDGFHIDVTGKVVLDAGISTGGFTDCVLKRGAAKVYGVDVGTGLVDWTLRNDPRVRLFEGTNIRYMVPSELPEKVDLALVDLSFISVEKVIGAIKGFLKVEAQVLVLIKPQFEVGKGQVGKGGIVKDPEKHKEVIERVKGFCRGVGLTPMGVMESPIKGAKGNREFWLHLSPEAAGPCEDTF